MLRDGPAAFVMPLLDQLERRLGRFAPAHVTLYLIIGQVFVTLSAMLGLLDASRLMLVPYLATHGEPWRIVSFVLLPPPVSGTIGLVLLPFAWWIFYLMGSALENYWGVFRYDLFLLVGLLLTVGAAFVNPTSLATNYYFLLGISLAFAWLNPDFELQLFFILPVKIKWLAALTLLGYAYSLVTGPSSTRWLILASIANLGLFFGRELSGSVRYRRRTIADGLRRRVDERRGPEPRHRCHICGKTDLTNPEMDFRYCSKCANDECYCPEHIFNHEHVLAAKEPTEP